jgi:hypothetical protein
MLNPKSGSADFLGERLAFPLWREDLPRAPLSGIALGRVFALWCAGDLEEMARYAQPSWCAGQATMAGMHSGKAEGILAVMEKMKNWFGNCRFDSWRVCACRTDQTLPQFLRAIVRLNGFHLTEAPAVTRDVWVTVTLVYEAGGWFFNPVSLLARHPTLQSAMRS